MAERVLLTGCCDRRRGRHVLFHVLATRDGPVIDAPRYCAGREAGTWRRERRLLDLASNRVSRYGCACRRSALIADRDIWDRIQRGDSEWFVATTNISLR
jgi:hypothetical protein